MFRCERKVRAGRRGSSSHADEDDESEEESESLHSALSQIDGEKGCEHYRRRCQIVAPCCDKVYWCRLCHDAVEADCTILNPDKTHKIDRKLITECVCGDCGYRQPVSQNCVKCHVVFGSYFCSICHFWDNNKNKELWHCDECGICRQGTRSNFFHCTECAACYPLGLKGRHVCRARAMHDVCPVCLDDMFQSIRPVIVLENCGHTIHQDCYTGVVAHRGDRCPLCMCPLHQSRNEALRSGLMGATAAPIDPDPDWVSEGEEEEEEEQNIDEFEEVPQD